MIRSMTLRVGLAANKVTSGPGKAEHGLPRAGAVTSETCVETGYAAVSDPARERPQAGYVQQFRYIALCLTSDQAVVPRHTLPSGSAR